MVILRKEVGGSVHPWDLSALIDLAAVGPIAASLLSAL